jgi:DNA-binding MarR family transcriptional regulator
MAKAYLEITCFCLILCSMSELSEKIQVTKPNVTLLINKLERLGYVERVNASHDRRIIFIKLSDAGDEFVESYVKKLHGYFTTMFSKLNSDDLGAFKSNISSLYKMLSRIQKLEQLLLHFNFLETLEV